MEDFDLEQLQKESEDANQKKGLMFALGNALNGMKAPSSYEMLHGGKIDRPDYAQIMNQASSFVGDPVKKRSEMAKAYLENRGLVKAQQEDEAKKQARAIDSKSSKAARGFWASHGFDVQPDDTEESLLSRYGSSADWNKIKAKEQIDFNTKKQLAELANQGRKDIEILQAQLAQKYPKPKDPLASEMQMMRMEQMRQEAERKKNEAFEKEQKLVTPYGNALTEDDAKKLKEAHESKASFDEKIKEMIDLRKKHGGGNIMNREDVSRGKQLSKDLLLEYKNMAKLGVLSSSDEAIINAIIPEDPLQFNDPYSALVGQDPTLHRLEKFKESSEKDFKSKLKTRLRQAPKEQEQVKEWNGKTYKLINNKWVAQ